MPVMNSLKRVYSFCRGVLRVILTLYANRPARLAVKACGRSKSASSSVYTGYVTALQNPGRASAPALLKLSGKYVFAAPKG